MRNSARIGSAIIDMYARVGDDVGISKAGKAESVDQPLCCVRDGIVIVPSNAVIPSGTVT